MEDTMLNTPNSHIHQTQDFDVMAAFSRLDTSRKMALFDTIMIGRPHAYRNQFFMIWPEASEEDARKLEIILRHRVARLNGIAA